MPRKTAIFRLQPFYSDKICRKRAKIRRKWALRPSFRDFYNLFLNYEPYWPENSQDFEQGVATYDPQAVGDAQRIARYTPIWYCPWVAVEP